MLLSEVELAQRIEKLEALQQRDAEFAGQLSAQIANVDNRLSADVLKALRATIESMEQRLTALYAEHKNMLDELAAIRAKLRAEATPAEELEP